MRILICGLNGSGKSTLGKMLAGNINYPFIDIEDYYFPNKNTSYKYDTPVSKEKVYEKLANDIKDINSFILVITNNCPKEILSFIDMILYLEVPYKIRMDRIKQRSLNQFGERVLYGGDLYQKEQAFYKSVASKADDEVSIWLSNVDIPTIRIDGTKDISDNIEYIKKKIF